MATKLEGGGGNSGRATKKIPLFFAASLMKAVQVYLINACLIK